MSTSSNPENDPASDRQKKKKEKKKRDAYRAARLTANLARFEEILFMCRERWPGEVKTFIPAEKHRQKGVVAHLWCVLKSGAYVPIRIFPVAAIAFNFIGQVSGRPYIAVTVNEVSSIVDIFWDFHDDFGRVRENFPKLFQPGE